MKFLPYERFKIRTLLGDQEVLKRLDNIIEPRRYRFFGSREKPYQGEFAGSHFEISRIIGYRNSFLPMITGDVKSEFIGCSVSISMYPHISVIIFILCGLAAVGSFFMTNLGSFISSLIQTSTANFSFLLPAGAMFGFGYVLTLAGFKFESGQSKKFFQELCEAEEIEEMGFANPFGEAG